MNCRKNLVNLHIIVKRYDDDDDDDGDDDYYYSVLSLPEKSLFGLNKM